MTALYFQSAGYFDSAYVFFLTVLIQTQEQLMWDNPNANCL